MNNVPKSDESDDDSIDARLRAKQDLRNSIHQHDSDDESDRNGSEEDCKNNFVFLSTFIFCLSFLRLIRY